MTDPIKHFASRVSEHEMNRREFIGRSMAAGLTLAAATTLYGTSAMAQEPKRGGHLKLGLQGGGFDRRY
ncbi:MAG: hypothetical protein RIF31_06980 [Thalassospira sp.]|uniref:hypothetical protein n=1 Tax=Thalassospira sp. TaxID=1912094 RepID=UPI0032F08B91